MNYYARVIEIITSPDYDFHALVIEIAKKHPKSVVEAADRNPDYAWLREVDALLRAEKKINAIKLWRQMAGIGLKEAKDAVEARQQVLGLRGMT